MSGPGRRPLPKTTLVKVDLWSLHRCLFPVLEGRGRPDRSAVGAAPPFRKVDLGFEASLLFREEHSRRSLLRTVNVYFLQPLGRPSPSVYRLSNREDGEGACVPEKKEVDLHSCGVLTFREKVAS